MLILSCPDSGAYPPDAVDVEVGGRRVVTVGLAPIAPLRSAWSPEEQVLLLEEQVLLLEEDVAGPVVR